MSAEALFWKEDLRVLLENAEARAIELARKVTDSDLRERNDAELTSRICEEAGLRPPTLLLTQARQFPAKEVRIRRRDFGTMIELPGTRVTIAIPFKGDRNLFFARPSSYTSLLPHAEVGSNDIRLEYTWTDGMQFDLPKEHARALKDLQDYLGWVRADVEKGSRNLADRIAAELHDKRRRLQVAEAASNALGLPVKQPLAAAPAGARPRQQPRATYGEREFDAFICHASEDKDFVAPLASGLQALGLNIWYDEFVLEVGDSLRRSIDTGLARSRFGVVVLSEPFFSRAWTQYELDGLVAKEIEAGKVILPIWRAIDVVRVRNYSPTLADRVALQIPPKSLEEVVAALARAIRS